MKPNNVLSILCKLGRVLKQSDRLLFLKSRKVTTELRDLSLLVVLSIVIPLTWQILLGWNTSMTLAHQDGLLGSQPMLKHFLNIDSADRGHWYSFLYHFGIFGGASAHDIIGLVPIYQICSFLGLTPGTSQNILNILIQIMISFFSIRTVMDLSTFLNLNSQSNKPLSLSSGLGILWITAFSPVIGWRIYAGHDLLLLGIFIFVVSLSIMISSLQSKLGLVQSLLAVFALVNAFCSAGQQLMLYSAIFGFPILCVLLYHSCRNSKTRLSLLVCFLIFLSAFGIAMPQFYSMFTYVTGSDAARSFGTFVTYSYVTATLHDWLSSIPWTLQLIPIYRGYSLWHEVNYAFGPLLFIFLLLWRWEKRWSLQMGTGILVSALMAILFSMNQSPFSQWLLKIFPLLNLFRVPERSILPFSIILPIVAITSLLQTHYSLSNQFRTKRLLSECLHGAILILGLFLSPYLFPVTREFVLWDIVFVVCIALRFYPTSFFSRHAGEILLILLGLGSLAAFKERVPIFESGNEILAIAEKCGKEVLSLQPALNSSLTRAKVNFTIRGIDSNAAHSMGISSLDGYWNPLVRFQQLVASLEGAPLIRVRNKYHFDIGSTVFRNLSQIYNVQYAINNPGGKMQVIPIGPTAGPAWFSASLALLPSFDQLGSILNKEGNQLFRRVHEVAWIVADDPLIKKMKIPTLINPQCASSKILDVKAPLLGQSARLIVENEALCPLTVSTNFSGLLKAYALSEGKKTRSLELFPTYGALTGIWVPAGVKEILLEPEPNRSIFSETSFYVGWGLLLIILIILAKAKEEVEPPSHFT